MSTIPATRVGVQRPRTLTTYACDRCGIRRKYRPGRGHTCKDCLDVLELDERRAS